MERVDFARWMLLFALCGTVVSTLAGSTIGVLIGTTYIVIAITATLVDIVEKGERNERRHNDQSDMASSRRAK